jgi:asparagine synthase (glutamine-hydrolysing)
MCGIAGIIEDGFTDRENLIRDMLMSIRHRGPDHTGIIELPGWGVLGHNRLSIIDLTAMANQPFVSNDGRYILVFNGEVYNYIELKKTLEADFVFRTQSDTEVLLAAYQKWGEDCLSRLIGMFAFSIWDNQEKTLFAARDRFGVKPFYYHHTRSRFSFGSEIKALWAAGAPKEKNNKVWSSYFTYGSYGMPNETFWKNIYQLPGGHFLRLRHGSLSVYKWYQFEDQVRESRSRLALTGEEEIIECYQEILQQSIQLRFRSDVDVGFNVSGGLDSSLLLSMIKKNFPESRAIQAFTFYTGHPGYDELPWVRDLMQTTGYPFHEVLLHHEEVPILAAKISAFQDEPYGGIPTIAYAKLFEEARRQHVLVLLDGQGIDEPWAGYDYYRKGNNNIVQGIEGSPVRPGVLKKEFRNLSEQLDYPKVFDEYLLDLQYRDLFFTKIPRALRFNDRISMLYSTELREPFLDHRLVEMAFALPERCKIKDDNGKYLIRKMTAQWLPDSIRHAPKRALQTPQREWLAHELRDWADQCIKSFASYSGVESRAVLNEWNTYLTEGGDNSFYIWQWINASYLV